MSSFPKSNAKKDDLASVSSQLKKVRVYTAIAGEFCTIP
jgi:hypothetical protein